MQELLNHKAYELLRTKYQGVVLDVFILKNDGNYEGIKTHQQAVIEAFEIFNKNGTWSYPVTLDTSKMVAKKISQEEFLALPDDPYYDSRPNTDHSYNLPSPLPYWFAFLEPPYSTPYTTDDFIDFNKALFPTPSSLEVYRWSDSFSDYFEPGKEWWGTALWTAYDASTQQIVVIGASATD